MDILHTQKRCLQVELYSHQKINYSELTDYFIIEQLQIVQVLGPKFVFGHLYSL